MATMNRVTSRSSKICLVLNFLGGQAFYSFSHITHYVFCRVLDVKLHVLPEDSYPPWAHGPGYIIYRDIAKFIVQGQEERDLKKM